MSYGSPLLAGLPVRTRLLRMVRSESRVRRFDWLLMSSAVMLSLYGAVLVYAATKNRPDLTGGDPKYFLKRHLLNMMIGLALAAATSWIDYRWIRALVPVIYLGSLLGLLAVMSPLGSTINGAHSWIVIGGGFSIQPAEYAKVALAVGMAIILADRPPVAGARAADPPDEQSPTLRRVVGALLLAGVPFGIIVLLPDLGTGMVVAVIAGGILLMSGIPLRWAGAGLVLVGVGVAAVIKLHLLATHQVNRFAAFADPKLDPQGVGYNSAQARLAIGSGGLTGQGLFHGTQTNGRYVPEQQTDFIFTVVGEELGFVGGVLLIALFAILLWRALAIAKEAEDLFSLLVTTGIICWFAFETFENIGMTLGIMPVAGIPLPFVSYGGSSMFADFIAIGILQNVRLRSSRPPVE